MRTSKRLAAKAKTVAVKAGINAYQKLDPAEQKRRSEIVNTIAMKIKPILDKCDAKEKHGLLCQQVDYFQTQHEWLTKLQIKNRLSKLRKKELLKDKDG